MLRCWPLISSRDLAPIAEPTSGPWTIRTPGIVHVPAKIATGRGIDQIASVRCAEKPSDRRTKTIGFALGSARESTNASTKSDPAQFAILRFERAMSGRKPVAHHAASNGSGSTPSRKPASNAAVSSNPRSRPGSAGIGAAISMLGKSRRPRRNLCPKQP